jgi:hypothetical protein
MIPSPLIDHRTRNRSRSRSTGNARAHASPTILSTLTPQTPPRNPLPLRQSPHSPLKPSHQLLQSKLINKAAATKSP